MQKAKKMSRERKEQIAKIADAVKERIKLLRMKKISSAAFSEKQIRSFRDLLEIQRAILVNDSKSFSDTLKLKLGSEPRSSRHAASNHIAESQNEPTPEENRIGNREKRLQKIEEALVRIDLGVYGVCDDCFRPIDIKRLRETTIADLCHSCKTSKEQEEKRLRRNGLGYRPVSVPIAQLA